MIPLNDLSRIIDGESERVLKDITSRVLMSGNYILGPEVESFEHEFATYLGVDCVTAVASGTDAIEIALRGLGVGRGSKVLVVPNAGGYTTTALIEIGAEPVYVDCDDMGRMNVESLERLIGLSPQPVCVVATHLYGLNSNIEEVLAVCQRNEVKLLEDCAQSTGAVVGGKRLGSFGDVATFSFYPTKNLGAVGDAGAIACSSVSLSEQHKMLRQYGWSSRYKVGSAFGRNSRMDEIQAAVLRLRLQGLDQLNSVRKKIWTEYSAAVEGTGWKLVGVDSPGFVAHLGVLVTPIGLRDSSVNYLNQQGVATAVHYPILDYMQPGWAQMVTGNCPNAEVLSKRILTVPLFPALTGEEVARVSRALEGMISELEADV